MSTPIDHLDRDRFISSLDTNFSVQAAAGAGKTTALVHRVASLARQYPDRLESVVLVTYTHRAADEMRQRLRSLLLEEQPNPSQDWIRGLSRMFIGTIHSFCLKLIRENALSIGYPIEVAPAPTEDRAIFDQWRQQQTPRRLEPWEATLHRFLTFRDIQSLARKASHLTVNWHPLVDDWLQQARTTALSQFIDRHALDSVQSRNAKSKATIQLYQTLWQRLADEFEHHLNSHLVIPLYDNKGGEELKRSWPEAMMPLVEKILILARAAVAREAADYQEFRFKQSKLTYADQIVLAHRLLQHEATRQHLREKNYRILLDEAQDTDPLQFELLIELTRPLHCGFGDWTTAQVGPRPGHFSMVGDAQQSIYRDRAHLPAYMLWHEKLSTSENGAALTLSQTFRCRPAIVDWVNDRFSGILTGTGGQVPYAPLHARTDSGTGQTLCWTLPIEHVNDQNPMKHTADWLIARLLKAGHRNLRASSWSEVALLCPAKAWLRELHQAAQRAGLASQLHFEESSHSSPAYLWLCALATWIADPENEFELIGILREIFGVSDSDIYHARFPSDDRRTPHPLNPLSSVPSVKMACESLYQALEKYSDLPPARRLERVAREINLADRLAAATDGKESAETLQQWLSPWIAKESAGTSPADFATSLVEQWDSFAPTRPAPKNDAIQLMTLKKAKGLQWDAVILPFLGKKYTEGNDRFYPRIDFPVGREKEAVLALKQGSFSMKWLEEEARDEQQQLLEYQRLYYVGCTRPRHTLILVDDTAQWTQHLKSGSKLPSPCAIDALRKDSEEREPRLQLSHPNHAPHPTAESISSAPVESSSEQTTIIPDSRDFSPIPIHQLSKQTPSELKEPATIIVSSTHEANAHSAALFGTWWHELMEFYPWRATETEIKRYRDVALEQLQTALPEYKDRANNYLSKLDNSPLRQLLASLPSKSILTEIPFSRKISDQLIQEGQIDLTFEHQSGEWTLLDWKTDAPKATHTHAAYLKDRYTPQLLAYKESLLDSHLNVTQTIIYSVPTGELIEI